MKRLAAILALAAVPALAGAEHRFTATVDYAGAPASDVPAALRISEALVDGFDYAAAGDGTHFTITDGTGAVLPYEIDAWNPGGESLLWVKIPYFVNGRKLTATYGDTERNMAARAAEVWSSYIGVWHLNATNALGRYPNSAGDARFDAEVSSFSRIGEAGRFGQSVLVYTNAFHGGKTDNERGGVFVPDGGSLDLSGDFAVSGWFYHVTVDNPDSGTGSKAFRWDNLFCKRRHPQTGDAANAGDTSGFGFRIGDNKTEIEKLELYGSSGTASVSEPWPRLKNGTWYHFAAVYEDGRGSTRLNGKTLRTNDVGIVADNDMPLAIGNNGTAWLDEPGGKAWGGRADEVRLIRGKPSADWLAAEYAAMTGALAVDSGVCTLTIDRNENFDDAVTVESDVPAVAEGQYRRGTTVTLTAVPGATGTFRKWYGDVPRAGRTNATVSVTLEDDAWIYARFVHPWTLAADKATMTDGHFKVNVSVKSELQRTLSVGRIVRDANNNLVATPSLLADDDAGSGTIDLGGEIRLPGDDTPWTISQFASYKSTQVVPTNHAGAVRAYLSPGTVTANNSAQIFHCGDDNSTSKPYAASYRTIILDEPAMTSVFNTYLIANQGKLEKLVYDVPRVETTATRCERSFYGIPLGTTKFDWWDLSSLSVLTNSFFASTWAPAAIFEMYRRTPVRGELSLPSLRGVDWVPREGTQLCLMQGVEGISLGGKDEGTTVTNLCTYAFAGNPRLRKVTLHAAPDMAVGRRIFADHTYNAVVTNEVVDGVSYLVGDKVSRGRVPDVIRFTGSAITEEAVANLLDACPVVDTAAKPVAIHASRYQSGWRRVDRADWISDPTPAERAAYPGRMLLGVYRAGAAAPAGKAVIVHVENDWDDKTEPTLLLLR